MSPLKDVLPRDMNNRKNVKKVLKDNNSNLLISYTDSPLMKNDALSFKGPHNPKANKLINFESEEVEFKEEKMMKEYK